MQEIRTHGSLSLIERLHPATGASGKKDAAMNKVTLLEKAKAVKSRKNNTKFNPGPADIELAVAWALGEVSGAQACKALGFGLNGRASFYLYMARTLALYVRTQKNRKVSHA